ncbi:MAG: hypothetical protein KQ78_00815 [Candidatus Izimaplasma bacterium HR2]|nr:MAG: hypothetical protein KQ78_00815 [Candidatus Izimaplasma bacterium HR2]
MSLFQFLHAPLYKEFKFKIIPDGSNYKVNGETFRKISELLNASRENIYDVYCIKCERKMSFSSIGGALNKYNFSNGRHALEVSGGTFINSNYRIEKLKTIGSITMTCLHKATHKYEIYFETYIQDTSYLVIRKIGQTPELYKIDNFENFGFRKQLEKMKIEKDFRDIHVMISHGYSIDTLLYIRRLLEKMIMYFLKDKTPYGDKFADKFKLAQEEHEFFDPELKDMTNVVYKLSSEGIHSLKHEQCEEYIRPLYNFIISQLDYMKEQDLKKIKKSKNNSVINNLFSKKVD